MSEWQEHIGVGKRQPTSKHRNGERTTVVKCDDIDRVAGYQVEKWDGRVAAHVTPETYVVNTKPRKDMPHE